MTQTCERIKFIQTSIEKLNKELAKPFIRLSINYANKSFLMEKDRWASSITLWDEQNLGIRVTPRMIDLAERLEVGSLSFERVEIADRQDEFFNLSESYSEGTLLHKIVLNEAGKCIETGFIITAPNEAQIMVVPNAMPCTLAIRCEEIALKFFEPEYDLEEYVVENWE